MFSKSLMMKYLKSKGVARAACATTVLAYGCIIAQPALAQDLNTSVNSFNTLVTNIRDFIILAAGAAGVGIAGYGIAKTFNVMEVRPGESRMKHAMAIIGGGALVGLVSLTDLASNTVLGIG